MTTTAESLRDLRCKLDDEYRESTGALAAIAICVVQYEHPRYDVYKRQVARHLRLQDAHREVCAALRGEAKDVDAIVKLAEEVLSER